MQRFGKLKNVVLIVISVLLEATSNGVILRELHKVILSWSLLLFLAQKGMPTVH